MPTRRFFLRSVIAALSAAETISFSEQFSSKKLAAAENETVPAEGLHFEEISGTEFNPEGFDPASFHEYPEWAEAAISETYARFQKWVGKEDVIVFPVMTDIHSGIPTIQVPVNWHDPKMHVLLGERAAEVFGADFLANLGDVGFDRDARWQPSTARNGRLNLCAQRFLYEHFRKPVLFSLGNHDHGSANIHLTSRDYGEAFNGLTRSHGFDLKMGPNSDYGYFDLPDKKFRAIFLNSSEVACYGFSTAQLQFLADALRLPEGWTAVAMQHYCVIAEIGAWVGSSAHAKNQETEIAIFSDFVKGGKGESAGVRWDFTDCRNVGLAGVLFGDSHFDAQKTQDGVNYLITQSYGTIQPNNLPENVRYQPFDRRTNLLVDVAAVKPSAREMRLFRIGSGGEASDRVFHW